ncbi:hypothetical protein G6F63_014756 [Rhizopus arrhizus]|nr:hypothetical protein G6F63_014756 [Rhizopus arrhizus]
MALDHIGGRLVDIAAVRLVDACGNDDLGGAVVCVPVLGRQRPVETAVDQFGNRRDRFVLAVGGIQRIQLLTGQVPGLAVAVQRMGLGPHLLHVDARRFAQCHGMHGPPARVAGWSGARSATRCARMDGGSHHGCAR